MIHTDVLHTLACCNRKLLKPITIPTNDRYCRNSMPCTVPYIEGGAVLHNLTFIDVGGDRSPVVVCRQRRNKMKIIN